MNWALTRMLLLTIVVLTATSSRVAWVSGDYTPSYCVISNVHVSSITPTDYSSTIVTVTTTFSLNCEGGTPGTVWNIWTRVFSESNLVGVNSVSSAVNQYSFGQGTTQFIVNNHFDAMNYYGYGEQTPSFYVQITAINSSTGSLDAQQQAPFAVDTSQYPFNLAQQNYCNFPGLSQYFQLLPGCGASTVNNTTPTVSSSSNCNVAGLPQFYQRYLPGCGGSGNESVAPNESSSSQPGQQATPVSPVASPNTAPNTSPDLATNTTVHDRSVESVLGIIILALAVFLVMLILKKRSRHAVFSHPAGLEPQGKFCAECGNQVQAADSFCWKCGEACPDDQDTVSFRL